MTDPSHEQIAEAIFAKAGVATKIDPDRFRTTVQAAIDSHPDREVIRAAIADGGVLSAEPIEGAFALHLTHSGIVQALGEIELAYVTPRPQG